MAFDLSDEELEATRRLHGLVKDTADKMFEELGYTEFIKNSSGDEIIKKKKKNNCGKKIMFFKEEKEVQLINSKSINMKELKAINKKVRELGWIKKKVNTN